MPKEKYPRNLKSKRGKFPGLCHIKDPLVVIYKEGKDTVCYVDQGGYDTTTYGIVVCDLIRTIAMTYKVKEEEIWKWATLERYL